VVEPSEGGVVGPVAVGLRRLSWFWCRALAVSAVAWPLAWRSALPGPPKSLAGVCCSDCNGPAILVCCPPSGC